MLNGLLSLYRAPIDHHGHLNHVVMFDIGPAHHRAYQLESARVLVDGFVHRGASSYRAIEHEVPRSQPARLLSRVAALPCWSPWPGSLLPRPA